MASGDYCDDLTISNDAVLWRNIPPIHFVPGENAIGVRPSSAAFMDDPDGSPMSVVLGDEVLQSGRTPESVIASLKGFALVELTASAVRKCGQMIVRAPTDEEPAHALVVGDKKKRFVWRIRGSFLALSWATAGGNAGGDSIIVLKWNVLWRSTKYRWPLL